jgi:hypothetical protein
MAEFQIMYWDDIPYAVRAYEGSKRVSKQLPTDFEKAIDAASMAAGRNVSMKPRVYIETTIVSYLTARPSQDRIIAANQEITREWWKRRRHLFDLCAACNAQGKETKNCENHYLFFHR